MTKDEILNMQAGREMDALIAEKVMGDNIKRFIWKRYGKPDAIQDPDYGGPRYFSTDIAAAWGVVEKMGYNWSLSRDVGRCGSDYETKGDMLYRFIYTAPGMPMEGVTAETFPLAVCRAALLAKAEQSSAMEEN